MFWQTFVGFGCASIMSTNNWPATHEAAEILVLLLAEFWPQN